MKQEMAMSIHVLPFARWLVALSMLVGSALLAGSQPAAAIDQITHITTGSGNSTDWITFIGQAKGFFKENNVEVQNVAAQSTSQVMQQITAGSGNIGSGGITDPLHAIDKGAKIALLRLQQGLPPYTLWAKTSIKTFADLRGKTIIVGGAKDITRIYLDRMVMPNGLKKGDYDLVYAGTTPSRFAALTSGSVDAAILLAPFSFRAEGQGFSLVGRLSDYVKDMPFTAFAVNGGWARANKQTVTGFLKGYQKANDWFYADGNRAEAVQILVKESRGAQGDIEATYDYLKSIGAFAKNGAITQATIAPLVKVLGDEGDLTGSPDPARFIDSEVSSLN
jgi:ABC-type nitrate/sulfonate/bicarbonate transport system substrate-binding protein